MIQTITVKTNDVLKFFVQLIENNNISQMVNISEANGRLSIHVIKGGKSQFIYNIDRLGPEATKLTLYESNVALVHKLAKQKITADLTSFLTEHGAICEG